MTATYRPTTTRARAAVAALALVAAVGTLAAVLGLDVHYDREFLQAQQSQTAAPQHAVAPTDAKAGHG